MPADETRAVARLPHLDIEIRHRKLPEDHSELLSISLRATPDLRSAAAFLDPFRLADPARMLTAWSAFNPWLAWLRLANPRAFSRLPGGGRDRT